MEEIVMSLHTRPNFFPETTSIDTTRIYPTSRLVSMITGIVVQPNRAIVGANAFAHEAGIHQDGVLKNPMTYEIMKPETIGLSKNSLVLGKHSGSTPFTATYPTWVITCPTRNWTPYSQNSNIWQTGKEHSG